MLSVKRLIVMQKSRFYECSYTILLGISFLVIALLWQFGGLKEQKPDEISHFLQDATDDFCSWITLGKSMEAMSAEISGDVEHNEMVMVDVAEGRDEISEVGKISVENSTEKNIGETEELTEIECVPEFYHADVSYFDNALFIGDSRTVGLYEYGGLGNAEVFAHSGMSIYKVFNEEFELQNGEKTTLEDALQEKQFGKVYIMLGINELGYDFDQTVERFSDAIELIRELQPQALIFIQANLHITNKKSQDSDLFNNTNIDHFNQTVGKLADGKKVFYLDVNPLYDDDDGGLAEEFTADHAHILGKYYVEWVDFILQNAVKVS